MSRAIYSILLATFLATPSAHAAAGKPGKLALARKAVLQLPGVQKLRASEKPAPDIDKSMKIHFAGPSAFVVSVAEHVDICLGCERLYLGKIKKGEVTLDLIGPKHPQIASQVRNMPPSTTFFSFHLDDKTKDIMMHGYGGALKPFTLRADGSPQAGHAFRMENSVRFDGQEGKYERVRIPE